MRVGVSGTQQGATQKQKAMTFLVLDALFETPKDGGLYKVNHTFRHGDCIGFDAQCHHIVAMLANHNPIDIVIHPSNVKDKRAFCKPYAQILPPKPPLERNPDIVKGSDVMVFGPKEYLEVIRSGTWTTYREAKRQDKKIIIVFPDGDLRVEPEGWFQLRK